MYRSKIVELVVDELTSGTDALADDEVKELANTIADRFVQECTDVYDDSGEQWDGGETEEAFGD